MSTQHNHFIPSTNPLPPGFVDAIWRANQAGAITWADVQHLETAYAPRCLAHDLPIKVTDRGGMCVRCVEELAGVENG